MAIDTERKASAERLADDRKARTVLAENRAHARRRTMARLLIGGGAVLTVVLLSPLWRPQIGPDVLLAARGDLSLAHAELFRDVVMHRGVDAAPRFFDEVPGALELLRAYVRAAPEAASVNVLDREILRAIWEQHHSGIDGIALVQALDARDYDLVYRQVRGNPSDPPDANAILAVDFERARKEILARPEKPENLVALLHWGVPRAEVERAIAHLPKEPEGFGDGYRIKRAPGLRIRILLDDQTLADPHAELLRRRLPIVSGSYAPPKVYPVRLRTVRPFAPGLPMTSGNSAWAHDALLMNPRDVHARAFLARESALPLFGRRTYALNTLIAAGDSNAEAVVRADLASTNGGVVTRGIDECDGNLGASLLASKTVREHRWPWVRIRAVTRLRGMGTPAARIALALYAQNSCRDARLIATGKAPYGIGRGVMQRLLIECHESNVAYLD